MKKKLLVLLITAASSMLMPNLVFAVAIDVEASESFSGDWTLTL